MPRQHDEVYYEDWRERSQDEGKLVFSIDHIDSMCGGGPEVYVLDGRYYVRCPENGWRGPFKTFESTLKKCGLNEASDGCDIICKAISTTKLLALMKVYGDLLIINEVAWRRENGGRWKADRSSHRGATEMW